MSLLDLGTTNITKLAKLAEISETYMHWTNLMMNVLSWCLIVPLLNMLEVDITEGSIQMRETQTIVYKVDHFSYVNIEGGTNLGNPLRTKCNKLPTYFATVIGTKARIDSYLSPSKPSARAEKLQRVPVCRTVFILLMSRLRVVLS